MEGKREFDDVAVNGVSMFTYYLIESELVF